MNLLLTILLAICLNKENTIDNKDSSEKAEWRQLIINELKDSIIQKSLESGILTTGKVDSLKLKYLIREQGIDQYIITTLVAENTVKSTSTKAANAVGFVADAAQVVLEKIRIQGSR